ncbi:MAG: bifunctional (p)ppGpp synthetase/guanosine-3',5'-bis(diphosphate) 3'-pyrophosphohydrolase [Pseudomonadota bacterium]
MTTADDLIARVAAYNPKTDAAMIGRAYAYASAAHEGQVRASGEPYFSHPVEVATMLTAQRLDDATIVTALLHDTVEDTGSTISEIHERFGEEIAQLVDGVTKLTNLQLSSGASEQAENFRKLLMAMSRDIRVLLVKLADRLHNMRTIRALAPEKQQRKARETMDIYAPLAGRMGMQWMREELEDLSFRVLNPEGRSSIMRRFISLRAETGDLIPRITDDIQAELDRAGVKADVTGREKKPFSIWRKIQKHSGAAKAVDDPDAPEHYGFHRLSDIYGFRIIAESERDCYLALGAVHRRWNAVPGRFKDYISQPKSNGYRSIHTTVSGRSAKRVEIQIRTREMHEVAETGVAAHWSYRDGERFENPFAVDPARWLARLTERFEAAENPDEFLEHVKLEMFTDQVFCFTPQGEVVKLPRGATPLDFAYAIHTRIGDSCVGAKVDGQRVPLWTRLRNGQSVVIIRAEAQRPQPSWEEMVVTGRAKAAIRRAVRDELRDRQITLGREIARVALERFGKSMSEKALQTAAKALALPDVGELLESLGRTELTGHDLVRALYPELVDTGMEAGPALPGAPILIGLDADEHAQPADCCLPLPGERVVGIAIRGAGVAVHAIDCACLAAYEDRPERWIDLRWSETAHRATYRSQIEVSLANDAGVLGRVCSLIGEHRANIADIRLTEKKPDFYRAVIDIEVRDAKHLHNIRLAIEADAAVTGVKRVRRDREEETPARD